MRVLLVFCHPRADSFCASLRDAAAMALETAGHLVHVEDLYGEGFSPALSAAERANYYDESANRGDVEPSVARLKAAEALLLVYPTWWFGMPAMLKGWLDRVWVPGVAFRLDGGGTLKPQLANIRRIGVITTYGSPRWVLWWVGWPDWRLFNRGVRILCAKGCRLEWLALYGMDKRTAPERETFLAKVKSRLAEWA